MRSKATVAPIEEDKEIHVHISVPKGSKVPFKVEGLKIGAKHGVKLHGTVKNISQDDFGNSMGMTVHGIDMDDTDTKPESLGDALKRNKKARTMARNMGEDE